MNATTPMPITAIMDGRYRLLFEMAYTLKQANTEEKRVRVSPQLTQRQLAPFKAKYIIISRISATIASPLHL